MPSVVIHEKIGKYIADEMGISSYDYYLGLLAPDTPNLYGFAPKEERWEAHQRRKNYHEWRQAIMSFYFEQQGTYPEDFLLGYYVHVITDIVFDEIWYIKVRNEIEKNYSTEISHTIMRVDMENYSFDGIIKIKGLLQEKNTAYDILNISKEDLLTWKEKKVSSWQDENKSKYITEEVIKNLEEKVYEEIKNMKEC